MTWKEHVVLWSLPLAVAWFVIALCREGKKDDSSFKIVHLTTTSEGRGDKYSVAYMAMLLVSVWGVWVMILTDKLTEWMWTTAIGAFVVGAVVKTGAAVAARIKGAPEQDPAAGDKIGASPKVEA